MFKNKKALHFTKKSGGTPTLNDEHAPSTPIPATEVKSATKVSAKTAQKPGKKKLTTKELASKAAMALCKK